jgi:cytochrome c oxidase subunit IV
MTAHATEAEHFAGSNRLFISVWGWLLVITAIEVFLGYIHLPLFYMLTILMGLSIIKAALIIAYFMHLRFERLTLVLTIVPALVICICLLGVFFPDSFRSLNLRAPVEAAPAAEAPH